MRLRLPHSLFGRTVLLMAAILCVFSLLVWQATMWAVVIPSAELTADMLAQRAAEAVAAHQLGEPLPAGASERFDAPVDVTARFRGFAYGIYLQRLRGAIASSLHASQVVITRARAPAEVWIRAPEFGQGWLVLTIRLARPEAPLAALIVFLLTTVLVLGVSAWSARRLTTPLARLAAAAAHVGEGRPAAVDTQSGPDEVRALAFALQSMSHRLAELNQERELMLAGVSHDLRSPLARMRVAIELLDVRDATLVREMTLEIETMDRMVGQFLQFVRAGYREAPVETMPDDVVRAALAPFAGDERVLCSYHAAEPRPLQVERLEQIVRNLVQNALEHGRPPVRVSTHQGADSVQLSVQDAGPGIAPADWPQALRPFDRLRAAPAAGHTGLGLALVDRLVSAARGQLSARRIEGGFVVSVELPTNSPRARA